MTRKESHAEAIRFLAAAAENMDQAYSYLKVALTDGAVETGSGPYRITACSANGAMELLLAAAREAICDDCTLPIADCQCPW